MTPSPTLDELLAAKRSIEDIAKSILFAFADLDPLRLQMPLFALGADGAAAAANLSQAYGLLIDRVVEAGRLIEGRLDDINPHWRTQREAR